MKVISLTSKIKFQNTVAAIGIFDGVHRGHQYLLKKMLAKARSLKAKSMVITFFPHPAHVLRPDVQLPYIVSFEERMRLLACEGVDVCVVVRFTKKFAHILPEYFIKEVLVKQLGVKALYVGDDFRFGRDRAGDVLLFRSLAKECDYQMCGVKALMQQGKAISSTRIRTLVTQGDMLPVQRLLGREFNLSGQVVKGKGRGKGLGFPTANVDYSHGVMPPNGVYAVKVLYKGKMHHAVANLGLRPTFKENVNKPLLEVYLLDFHRDIYGQTVNVFFIKKIRDEQTFPNLDALKTQIQKDVQKSRILLKT